MNYEKVKEEINKGIKFVELRNIKEPLQFKLSPSNGLETSQDEVFYVRSFSGRTQFLLTQ